MQGLHVDRCLLNSRLTFVASIIIRVTLLDKISNEMGEVSAEWNQTNSTELNGMGTNTSGTEPGAEPGKCMPIVFFLVYMYFINSQTGKFMFWIQLHCHCANTALYI